MVWPVTLLFSSLEYDYPPPFTGRIVIYRSPCAAGSRGGIVPLTTRKGYHVFIREENRSAGRVAVTNMRSIYRPRLTTLLIGFYLLLTTYCFRCTGRSR